MLDQPLRRAKEALFQPLIRGPLARLDPNRITQWACAIGLLSAISASLGLYRWALLAWLLNRFLDGLDGTLARVTGRQSDWGGYQDIVLDHLVYASLPLGIALASGNIQVYQACALLQACYFVNTISWCYLSALLEKRKHGSQTQQEMTSVTMPAAVIEGSETLLFFTLFLLFPKYAAPLFLLKAGLVSVGVWQRWVFARRCLQN